MPRVEGLWVIDQDLRVGRLRIASRSSARRIGVRDEDQHLGRAPDRSATGRHLSLYRRLSGAPPARRLPAARVHRGQQVRSLGTPGLERDRVDDRRRRLEYAVEARLGATTAIATTREAEPSGRSTRYSRMRAPGSRLAAADVRSSILLIADGTDQYGLLQISRISIGG